MSARISLRDYQRELAERLRNAEAAAAASLLGIQVGDEAWLVDLTEAGEVVPPPPITPVPLTRPWFRGLANVRGNLYSVIDFPAFLQRPAPPIGPDARLLVLGERFALGAALLVTRSLGLRNAAQLTRRNGAVSPWARAHYSDSEGRLWKELDVAGLAQHPQFLAVGVS